MPAIRREPLSSTRASARLSAEEGALMSVAIKTKKWTLEELHSLPDDGNKYELVRGELFVTPPPAGDHETIAARIARILDPYVERHGLGLVYRPRAVFRFEGSEVEPDLMVRREQLKGTKDWDEAPHPTLIVEILSPSTRRRDQNQKRQYYVDSRIPEYWIVDSDRRVFLVVRPGEPDMEVRGVLTWTPPGVASPLTFDVARVFPD
jgi:Uma2 family endonuclease